MVIPLGGGGDDGAMGRGMMAPDIGPPPAFLLRRFLMIKICLVAMILSIFMQLGSGIALMPADAFNIILNVCSALIIVLVGIFLLKDDAMFRGTYECLVGTFCSTCRDQCQGGLTCLCSWFAVCLISAVLSLIPFPGSQIYVIVDGFRLILDKTFNSNTKWNYAERTTVWYVLYSVYLASEVILLIAQIAGAYHGFKGFRDMSRIIQEADVSGGGYGDPYDQNRGGGYSGGGSSGGGYTGGGYGGGGQRLGGGPAQQESMGGGRVVSGGPARSPPALFSGQGQRLGS